jgi:hypothetical protein
MRTSARTHHTASAIEALLERLDPRGNCCTVPGCVHHHGTTTALEATWVGNLRHAA